MQQKAYRTVFISPSSHSFEVNLFIKKVQLAPTNCLNANIPLYALSLYVLRVNYSTKVKNGQTHCLITICPRSLVHFYFSNLLCGGTVYAHCLYHERKVKTKITQGIFFKSREIRRTKFFQKESLQVGSIARKGLATRAVDIYILYDGFSDFFIDFKLFTFTFFFSNIFFAMK